MENPERPNFNSSDIDDNLESYQAFRDKEKDDILSTFTPEQQREIESKKQILSSLALFIGKDFKMPVELNKPGAGWHWDFKENVVRIDPKDLIEKPINYLRFVISHEGGHRRISRTDFIPLETWRQPGFSFMMNAIEDPRDNNFVAEKYPAFRKQMDIAYETDLDFEGKSKEKAQTKLGYQPRFMQAGFEYIKQWFKEQKDEETVIDETLPEDVKAVISKTLESARSSWWTYPAPEEADQSEELISRYAEASYKMNLDQIWPEFQKLVEKDMEDQKTQELLKDMEQSKGEGQGMPQDLKDKLSPSDQKELEEAIERALDEAKKQKGEEGQPQDGEPQKDGQPINLDSLSDELKQKIKDYFDSLPEEKKQELQEKAQKAIADFEKELNREMEGKLSDNPEQRAEREEKESSASDIEPDSAGQKPTEGETDSVKKFRQELKKELQKDANIYEEKRREVLPIIDKLENELRAIFRNRKARRWETGKKSGPSINIQHRIGEIAQGIPSIDSHAWQKREKPTEKDYAITLLVDLSGSMQGENIQETFKSVIVLAEVLNRLSINTEIIGFNDRVYEYQKFNEKISNEVREKMGGMLLEVSDDSDTGKARWNDDGWALEQASERLNHQKEAEKFLIVLSDGLPVESAMHPRRQYELSKIIAQIRRNTKQKLIGLGIGPDTDHVKKYYPNSLVTEDVSEMAENLSALIKDAIEHYERF